MIDDFHSPAREQLVLSYINLDGSPALQVANEHGVTVDTFFGDAARRMYGVAADLHAAGTPLCAEILSEEAVFKRKVLTLAEYIDLTRQNPGELGSLTLRMPPLCRELRALQKKRELQRANEVLALALRDGDRDKILTAVQSIHSADINSRPRAQWNQIGGVEIDRALAIIRGDVDPDIRSIPWPWRALDSELKPFRRGEQVVVAGYTSNGKSSLLRQLLLAAAYRGFNTAMVSMEVPAGDIFNLMASAVSGQPWSRLKDLHPKDKDEFVRGAQKVRGMNIEVLDDTTRLPEIMAWLRNQHARRFLDVIAIDYLGLVAECSPQKGQTKAAAVGEVAAAFKRLAAEIQCVLFLAVQINRGPSSDGNRQPRLSDLKDSGDIEAHADRALLLFRPDIDRTTGSPQAVHEPIADRPRYYMQLLQEKGRNVGTGSTELWLRRELAKFELIQQ